MMSNAGRTRSFGAETAISYSIADFTLNGSYGYTNARFLSYNSGTTSYAGNYIPYAPTHTFALSGDYSINVGKWIDRILLHCDLRGAGALLLERGELAASTVLQPARGLCRHPETELDTHLLG